MTQSPPTRQSSGPARKAAQAAHFYVITLSVIAALPANSVKNKREDTVGVAKIYDKLVKRWGRELANEIMAKRASKLPKKKSTGRN